MPEPARLPLYCLPYAGASASVYTRWKRRLAPLVDVIPVELPGRGRRMAEALEVRLPALLDRLVAEIRPQPGRPFALFGHSLGAVLAFELAARLEARGARPALVFVSGTRSPGHRDYEHFAALQSDEELRAELERLDGTPPEVLADHELMQFALRVLRADFQVAASYTGSESRRIHAPLVALGGADDDGTRNHLDTWRDHTTSEFSLHVLPGGHFFIHQQEADVLAIIEKHARLAVTAFARSQIDIDNHLHIPYS